MFNFKKKKENLPENFDELIKEILLLKKENKELKKELANVREIQRLCLQKAEIIRFNPFSEGGGNQSFSLALLDDNNDGVVVTALYTKEGSRVYGKPIKEGKSEFSLSEEEKKAIEKACKKN